MYDNRVTQTAGQKAFCRPPDAPENFYMMWVCQPVVPPKMLGAYWWVESGGRLRQHATGNKTGSPVCKHAMAAVVFDGWGEGTGC